MEDTAALYARFLNCAAVSTDSRQEQANTLFFALNGPSFRGSDFASQALARGARHAVVDDATLAAQDPAHYTYAPDPLEALQQLAHYHRRQLSIPVLAITGSNGKTTTKELVNAVLSQRYRVQYTRGNLNNHIGVPLTLLSIKPEHELAIVEMGANHQGEIDMLCRVAAPTHGLLTNIGKAHLEGFGGEEGVARGKGELLRYLATHNGTAFLNTADTKIAGLVATVPQRITYPNDADTYPAALVATGAPTVTLRLFDGTTVAAQITGDYNFPNLAAAAAVGAYFNVPTPAIAAALAAYAPANNRSQLVRTSSNEVVLDAYNANPSSMAAALRSFAARPGAAVEKAVILGDMFELGEASPAEHRALGELLTALPIGTVLLCGTDMHYAAVSPDFHYFPTKAEAAVWLQAHSLRQRQILIKGSRGMGLETLLTLV